MYILSFKFFAEIYRARPQQLATFLVGDSCLVCIIRITRISDSVVWTFCQLWDNLSLSNYKMHLQFRL